MALSNLQIEQLLDALRGRVPWATRVLRSPTEPTPRPNEILIWQDTTNDTTKILLNQGGTTIIFRPAADFVSAVSAITTLTSSTAGGTYGATEQTMLQEAHDTARQVLAALKGIGDV